MTKKFHFFSLIFFLLTSQKNFSMDLEDFSFEIPLELQNDSLFKFTDPLSFQEDDSSLETPPEFRDDLPFKIDSNLSSGIFTSPETSPQNEGLLAPIRFQPIVIVSSPKKPERERASERKNRKKIFPRRKTSKVKKKQHSKKEIEKVLIKYYTTKKTEPLLGEQTENFSGLNLLVKNGEISTKDYLKIFREKCERNMINYYEARNEKEKLCIKKIYP